MKVFWGFGLGRMRQGLLLEVYSSGGVVKGVGVRGCGLGCRRSGVVVQGEGVRV